MRPVLVSHPHAAAVSVAVARAFERAGRLSALVTGIAASREGLGGAALRGAAGLWPRTSNRLLDLPAARVRSLAGVELAARLVALVGTPSARPRRTYDTLFRLHDAAVAALSWPRDVAAVWAFEDAALRTFARAERAGAARILDVPAVHADAQRRLWSEEARRWPGAMSAALRVEPGWKAARKRAELSRADVVRVASAFARRTLEEADVRRPIMVAPYGFPLARFPARERPGVGPFTVLSVGAHDLRKGTPYLLEAWRRAGLKDARLRLVGPLRLSGAFLAGYRGLFEHVPHVARAGLGALYRDADLLAFPTLGDGFGLVIQEAMCSGIPVLTTPCGGGPECLDDGVEGWLVPPRDVDALVERLRWGAANRGRLAEMGRDARARAERFDERAAELVLLDGIDRALAAPSPSGALEG